MFTQCPQCNTAFRVTATMLKAARGKVRCGRCAHVFNALTFLIDSDEPTGAAAGAMPAPAVESPGEPTAEIVEETLPTEPVWESAPEDSESAVTPAPAPPSAPASTPPAQPATARATAAPARRPAERRYDDFTPLEEDEEEEGDAELVLDAEENTTAAAAADAGAEADADDEELLEIQFDDGGDDVPESALEFTATDLSQVFVETPLPEGARSPDEMTASDDATAEHEIIDIEEETPAAPEVITLEGDSVVIVEESGAKAEFRTGEYPELQAEEPAAALVPEPLAATVARKPKTQEAIDAEVREEIEKAFAADPTTRAEFVLPSGRRVSLHRNDDEIEVEELEAAIALERDTSRQRKTRIAWGVGGVLLSLALAIQVVHYKRQALVQTAVVGPLLTRVYGVFGSELTPPWDVRAFQLRQWGAAADPDSGTLRVRASLLNGAEHAQPYPLLRLTLQDRFGERLRQRDIEPRDYLPRPPANGQLLGAGQRVDADIAIVDPGEDAVGFEIDVCLRKQSSVTCANDAPRQPG